MPLACYRAAMLIAEKITKEFATPTGKLTVLKGLDLEIRRGSSVSLMGDSGCGKSTLLHLLTGLDYLSSGTLSLDGEALHKASEQRWSEIRQSKVGLVFQHFNLIPSLTVAQNIRFHAALSGNGADASAITEHLGLKTLVDRRPEELSGGQQQRVAIARTLVAKPDYIFADEPTGNLDEASSARVLGMMLDIVADSDAALFMVTHSKALAAELDRQLVLRDGVCSPADI